MSNRRGSVFDLKYLKYKQANTVVSLGLPQSSTVICLDDLVTEHVEIDRNQFPT